jgi:hypothetical protein
VACGDDITGKQCRTTAQLWNAADAMVPEAMLNNSTAEVGSWSKTHVEADRVDGIFVMKLGVDILDATEPVDLDPTWQGKNQC